MISAYGGFAAQRCEIDFARQNRRQGDGRGRDIDGNQFDTAFLEKLFFDGR